MTEHLEFYIDGRWVAPAGRQRRSTSSIRRPSRPSPASAPAAPADVDRAVAAARRAFETFGRTQPRGADRAARADRRGLRRSAWTRSPRRSRRRWARRCRSRSAAQAPAGLGAPQADARRAEELPVRRSARARRASCSEPIGVCGLITPWNWPLNQIVCKVAPALAAGCTMVLKPSEIAPLSGIVSAEVLHEAGVPAGVFNLVNGDGPGRRRGDRRASRHRHGVVHRLDARRHRRSPRPPPTRSSASRRSSAASRPTSSSTTPTSRGCVKHGVRACFNNSGQSCNAPTRMLVPRARLAEAVDDRQGGRRRRRSSAIRTARRRRSARWSARCSSRRSRG